MCSLYNVCLPVMSYVAQCHVQWISKMKKFKITEDKTNLRGLFLGVRIADTTIGRAHSCESQLAAPMVLMEEKHGTTEHQESVKRKN